MSENVRVNSQLLNLEESATVAMNQRVKDLRAKGENVVHFGFGQSPFPVHKSIQEALCKHADKKAYMPTKGLPELRESISKFIKSHFGYDYSSENIIIGPGSKQLLYQATAVLEGPFVLPGPSWVSYGPQAEILGKPIFAVQTRKDEGYKLTASDLERVCSSSDHRQRLLILNNPNNPTGSVYTKPELKELAEVCRDNQVIVLSDEIYAHVSFGEDIATGIAEFYPEGTLVSGGLSKAFHAGGYRLGFIAAPDGMEDAIKCLSVMSSETYTSVSTPTQYAALEAFTNPDVLENARECSLIHEATAKYLYNGFRELNMGCVEPRGAFYLFPDFDEFRPQLRKLGIRNARMLCKHLLEEYRVASLPAGAFYCSGDLLACRITTVDYDGEKVLEASRKANALDEAFVEQNCPQLKLGLDRIAQFISDIGQ